MRIWCVSISWFEVNKLRYATHSFIRREVYLSIGLKKEEVEVANLEHKKQLYCLNERKMERGLQELVSCSFMSASISDASCYLKTPEDAGGAETADQSCELNQVIIYPTNAFPSSISHINSFKKFPKSTSTKRKNLFVKLRKFF